MISYEGTIGPFDLVNALTETKEPVHRESSHPKEVEKDYEDKSFVVLRAMSYWPDTVFLANEMNLHHHLPGSIQMDYLMATVQKKVRPRKKWISRDKEVRIDAIRRAYGVNLPAALDMVDLIPEETLNRLVDTFKLVTKKG
jgi:hypothetical protein